MTTTAKVTDDDLVTLREASRLFGRIPPRTLRHWIAAGRLRSFQPGRKHLVRVGDMKALLAGGCRVEGRPIASIGHSGAARLVQAEPGLMKARHDD